MIGDQARLSATILKVERFQKHQSNFIIINTEILHISNMGLLADTVARRIHLDAPSKRVIASHVPFPIAKYHMYFVSLSELATTNIDETPDQKIHGRYFCQI